MKCRWPLKILVLVFCGGAWVGCGQLDLLNSPNPSSETVEPPASSAGLPATPGEDASGWSPQIAAKLRQHMRESLGLATLEIEQYQRQTWPDGCLGLGQPDEVCLAMLTEGWQVQMLNPDTGERWIYRTDLTGDTVRSVNPVATD